MLGGVQSWRTPYPTVPSHEILQYIDDGNRPVKPDLFPEAM